MIVVSDTTAISNLIRIGEIRLLTILYGKILIPKTVYDELKGRKVTSEKSIKIIGTLGILIKAKQAKLIDSVKDKMDDLRSIGFWINQSLYDKILALEKTI